jgi:uncharacterized membrane protein YjgN (DUF898 family)
MCFKWAVLTLLTLGFGFWYFSFKADQFKYNGLMYGGEKFNFTMTFGEYSKILVINTLKLLLALILMVSLYTGASLLYVQATGDVIKTDHIMQNSAITFGIMGSFGMILLFLYLYLTSSLLVKLFKAKIASLFSKNISFETNITVTRAMKYHFVNAVIIICTFGIGFPLALANNIKLYAKTIKVNVPSDLLVSNHMDANEGKLSSSFDDMFADGFDLDMFDAF